LSKAAVLISLIAVLLGMAGFLAEKTGIPISLRTTGPRNFNIRLLVCISIMNPRHRDET
jgi:hypothetical protein